MIKYEEMDEKQIAEYFKQFGVNYEPVDTLAIDKWLKKYNLDAIAYYGTQFLLFGPLGYLYVLAFQTTMAMAFSAILIPVLFNLALLFAWLILLLLLTVSALTAVMLQPYLLTLVILLIFKWIYEQIVLFWIEYGLLIEDISLVTLIVVAVLLLILYCWLTTIPWTIFLLYDSMFLSTEWCSIIIILFGGNQELPSSE